LIPSGPLLLVSPHLDDAVFSCAALVERPEPIDVLTVASGAPDPPRQGWWDAQCGFASSAESIPARLAEDDAAFAGTHHRRSHLGLLELQYQPERTRAEAELLGERLREWVAANPGGIVAIPAGAGCSQRLTARWRRRLARQHCSPPQHPDHVWVRDTAFAALMNGAALLLYEEIPYLFGEPADAEAERAASRRGLRSEPLSVGVDPAQKARRIAAYASQIAEISPSHGRLDDPRTLPAEERYWLLRRSTTSS
jgi:LmbE family N-acetylglucosaminyl deacetylase